eukprot:5434950-Lingulodinium_polyedra.AAC.1
MVIKEAKKILSTIKTAESALELKEGKFENLDKKYVAKQIFRDMESCQKKLMECRIMILKK